MERLHTKGYAHMDIKMDNLVICEKQPAFKLIDFGMVKETTTYGLINYTEGLTAPVFNEAYFRCVHGETYKEKYGNALVASNANYRAMFETMQYYEEINHLNAELFKKYPVKRDTCIPTPICQYNDQYAIAVMLEELQAENRGQFVEALLTTEGYFLKGQGGGRLQVTKSGHIDLLGRRRVLYKTSRGKQYVRMAGRLVAVAELRRRKANA
jgi:serine/threonine protein kinase